eukprot:690847-Rhodomonas_salina.1
MSGTGVRCCLGIPGLCCYARTRTDSFYAAMPGPVGGIPQFLLLSNLRGEMQLLVPVLPPRRPKITTQPFTTRLVMDRTDQVWLLRTSGLMAWY